MTWAGNPDLLLVCAAACLRRTAFRANVIHPSVVVFTDTIMVPTPSP